MGKAFSAPAKALQLESRLAWVDKPIGKLAFLDQGALGTLKRFGTGGIGEKAALPELEAFQAAKLFQALQHAPMMGGLLSDAGLKFGDVVNDPNKENLKELAKTGATLTAFTWAARYDKQVAERKALEKLRQAAELESSQAREDAVRQSHKTLKPLARTDLGKVGAGGEKGDVAKRVAKIDKILANEDLLKIWAEQNGKTPQQARKVLENLKEAILSSAKPIEPEKPNLEKVGTGLYVADPEKVLSALGGDPAQAKFIRDLGGTEGSATLVEISGRKFVRKFWPASQSSEARVQNEIFYHDLVDLLMGGGNFRVSKKVVARPVYDSKGQLKGHELYTSFEEIVEDPVWFKTGRSADGKCKISDRVRLAALKFIWGLSDMHDGNVQRAQDGRIFLLDFEMAGNTNSEFRDGKLVKKGTVKVFDRSALTEPTPWDVDVLIRQKKQPYFNKFSDSELKLEDYVQEKERIEKLLEDSRFVSRLIEIMRRANWSDAQIQKYLTNPDSTVKTNLKNFERNLKPFLEEVNEIIRERKKKAELTGVK